ncbi:MAG: ATP-binding cassette domain-containing protein [Acidimicrobiales bacterium]
MIEAHGLTKRYGHTVAVDDLSFEVRPGHVTGFLGPNGAGKSTTMRMIVGLDAPSRGRVTVDSRLYHDHHRPLFEVGALLEAKAIHGGRSAFNHLLCLAQSNGIGRRRVDEVLEMVGLTAVARRRAGGFSLGMGQRLGIAAALLGDPGTLLFDEPVNGLDPEGIRWIRQLLQRLAAEGRTVFVSSHLMSEMAITAEHLIVIGRGRLIADTSVADFVRRSSQNYVRVRAPEAPRLARLIHEAGAAVDAEDDGALAVTGLSIADIGDLAAAHGLALHELSPQAASLEEAFMELTGDSVEYRTGAGGPAGPAADGADPGSPDVRTRTAPLPAGKGA